MDVFGHDSVPALRLAMAGLHLHLGGDHKDGAFVFMDWEGDGFPVPNNMRDMLIGHGAKYLRVSPDSCGRFERGY